MKTPETPIQRKEPGMFQRMLRMAALFAFVLGGVWLYNQFFDDKEDHETVITTQSLHSVDSTASTTLSDGSYVKLNTYSSLKYPKKFKGNTREVTLKGEAFFEVEHHPKQPFIIHAGKANIKVLGTSFTVNAYPESDSIVVTVETGKILLYSGDQNTQLTDGLMGVFYPASGEIKMRKTQSPMPISGKAAN